MHNLTRKVLQYSSLQIIFKLELIIILLIKIFVLFCLAEEELNCVFNLANFLLNKDKHILKYPIIILIILYSKSSYYNQYIPYLN